MSLSSDFYNYLSTAAGVVSAVGYKRGASGPAKVWAAGHIPEGTDKPYIAYSRSPEQPDSSYKNGSDTIYTKVVWRLECYGSTRIEAQTVADAVYAALHRTSGTMGSTQVCHSFVDSASDDDLGSGDGSETNDHMVPLEVDMAYRQAVTSPTLS